MGTRSCIIATVSFLGVVLFSLWQQSKSSDEKLKEVEYRKAFGIETYELLSQRTYKYPIKRSIEFGETDILVVTRVHASSATSLAPVQSIVEFVKSIDYAAKVLICIGADNHFQNSYLDDLFEALKIENIFDKSEILPITPWGGFTHALNIAVTYALGDTL